MGAMVLGIVARGNGDLLRVKTKEEYKSQRNVGVGEARVSS